MYTINIFSEILKSEKILPSDFFCDRVLDLKSRVDLHEVVIAGNWIDQELDGAGVRVADALAQVDGVAKNGLADLKQYKYKLFSRIWNN